MRRIALTLALAVLSLAFAPAPFPRAGRASRDAGERLMRECEARLRALGLSWRLVSLEEQPWICLESHDRNGVVNYRDWHRVEGDDVPRSLRAGLRSFR